MLPIDSQFAVSTKQFAPRQHRSTPRSAAWWSACPCLNSVSCQTRCRSLLYLVALIFGVAVHYSIMLGLAAVSFGSCGRRASSTDISISSISRAIRTRFSRIFRFIFGWIIPVVIIANIPARLLIKVARTTRPAHVAPCHRLDGHLLVITRFLALCVCGITRAPALRIDKSGEKHSRRFGAKSPLAQPVEMFLIKPPFFRRPGKGAFHAMAKPKKKKSSAKKVRCT